MYDQRMTLLSYIREQKILKIWPFTTKIWQNLAHSKEIMAQNAITHSVLLCWVNKNINDVLDAQVSGTNTLKGFFKLMKESAFFKETKLLRNEKNTL